MSDKNEETETEETETELTEGSVFIAMNQDGSWEVADDGDDAMQRLIENHGATQSRVGEIVFKMKPPSAPESVEVIIPDDPDESEVEVVEEEEAA